MLAQLQRLTTLTLLLFAGAWMLWAFLAGQPILAAAGAAVILLGFASVLALEFVVMHAINRSDPSPRATVGQLVQAWLAEVAAAVRVFCWRQPFRASAFPDQCGPNSRGQHQRVGVVLVHGFFCNRGLWNPWLKRLKASGIPFIAVNLEPILASIDDYASTIEDAVQRLTSATGRPPVMVCHSMGGLAARAWLRSYQAHERVAHIITIGTPHQGTWLAWFGQSRSAQQMQLHSPWLMELSASETAHGDAKFTCFYGHCDNIVFPATSACLPGARNILLLAKGHLQMAQDESVFQALLRRLVVASSALLETAVDRSLPLAKPDEH